MNNLGDMKRSIINLCDSDSKVKLGVGCSRNIDENTPNRNNGIFRGAKTPWNSERVNNNSCVQVVDSPTGTQQQQQKKYPRKLRATICVDTSPDLSKGEEPVKCSPRPMRVHYQSSPNPISSTTVDLTSSPNYETLKPRRWDAPRRFTNPSPNYEALNPRRQTAARQYATFSSNFETFNPRRQETVRQYSNRGHRAASHNAYANRVNRARLEGGYNYGHQMPFRQQYHSNPRMQEVLASGRDFTPEDYEMLLELDGRNARGLNASQIDICVLKTVLTHTPDEPRCCICLEDFGVGDEVTILRNCVHKFHPICCSKWLKIQNSCPVCQHKPFPTQ